MQHAKIDSNSTASILTGIPFSSVSLSSPHFNHNKANPLRDGMAAFGFVLRKSLHIASGDRSLKAGTTVLRPGEISPFSWVRLMITRINENFLNMRRWPSGLRCETLSLASLREWLWLMLEARRGLRVQ